MAHQKISVGHKIKEKDENDYDQCGDLVELSPSHLVVTGQTQEAGKTTALEKLSQKAVEETGSKVLVFITKKDEDGFRDLGEQVKPYYRDEVDWEYVVQILETAMNKSMDFKEPWIIKSVQGNYPGIQPADTLRDVWENVQTLLANHRDEEHDFNLRGMEADVYVSLNAYFEKVVPKLEEADLATKLELNDGINLMDLRHLDRELQSLVIGKTVEKIYEDDNLRNSITIIPEAWKFLPQGSGSPCKKPVETFVREAAGQDKYLWIDSQDMTGMEKTILKQVNNWIMGYQNEKNEVERTRDQMPLTKRQAPGKEEVMSLKIGEFFLCNKSGIQKVYIDPSWINEIEIDGKSGMELAKAIACREISSEDVKLARKAQMEDKDRPEPKVMTPDGDDEEYDTVEEATRGRKEDKDRDTLEKKVSNLEERIEGFKQQVETYEETVEEKDKRIEQLKGELEEAKDRNSNLQTEVERLRKDQEKSSGMESPVKDTILNKQKKQKKQESSVSEKRVSDLEDLVEDLQDRLDEIGDRPETEAETVEAESISEERIKELIQEEIPDENFNPVENVSDQILENFQENTVDSLMDKIDDLSKSQKKLVLYLEGRGKGIGSKKAWVKNGLGWKTYGSRMREEMNDLENEGFVRVDSGGNIYPQLKNKVEDRISGYSATDAEIQDTYNKLLARIDEEVEL